MTSEKLNLALFDLDHTLLPIDSDYAWGVFTTDIGWTDPHAFRQKNDDFYAHYQAGTLDIHDYVRFAVEAVRPGAKQIDGSVRRFGAGAGNAPVEALIGVFDKIGVKTGIDFFDIADAAEEVVAPAMPAECLLDRNALIMGYSGVYSSFLKHAIRQSERYGVPAHQLLHRAGQRKLIGGQEDQLIDIALAIKREQEKA